MFKLLQKTFWDLNFRWSKTTLKKILKVLEVDDSNMPKTRYGRKGDGGYIIFTNNFDEKENYHLLSFGIDNEISFEKEIFEKHPNIHIHCFDPTVNSPFPKNGLNSPRLQFYKKGIIGKRDANIKLDVLPIDEIFSLIGKNINQLQGKQCFIKMDIEGAEWNFFEHIPMEWLKQFDQIAIELHFRICFGFFEKLFFMSTLRKRLKLLEKITSQFKVLHVHANNGLGFKQFDDFLFPLGLEVSFLHKRFFDDDKYRYNNKHTKVILDYPNVEGEEDYQYPFLQVV